MRRSTLTSRLGGVVALALAILVAAAAPAHAAWPERPITVIVHFPPGGANDLLGRLIAAEANGNIGLTAAARAAPDGYTLVVASGVVLINPSINKVAYDPLKDFAPIAFLGASPNMLLTRPDSGINSVADLVARAKANPGKVNYRLAKEVLAIMRKPEVREKMLKASFEVKPEGPEALAARIAREVPMWKDIVDRAGIKAN